MCLQCGQGRTHTSLPTALPPACPPARPSAPALLLQFQKERDALQAELDSLKHAQEETKKELDTAKQEKEGLQKEVEAAKQGREGLQKDLEAAQQRATSSDSMKQKVGCQWSGSLQSMTVHALGRCSLAAAGPRPPLYCGPG